MPHARGPGPANQRSHAVEVAAGRYVTEIDFELNDLVFAEGFELFDSSGSGQISGTN